MSIIEKAKLFAIKSHKNQMYGEHPYSKHLEDVYKTALRFGIKDENILASCYLHDVVEDTKTSLLHIKIFFNDDIMDIVRRVTNEPAPNRKEMAIKTYPKIRGHEKATIVKLCDRISNVENCIYEKNHNKFKMYSQEFKKFKEFIYVPGISDDLWVHLETLFEKKK